MKKSAVTRKELQDGLKAAGRAFTQRTISSVDHLHSLTSCKIPVLKKQHTDHMSI